MSMHSSVFAMEHALSNFVDIISKPFVTIVSLAKHEEKLLTKPAISPLPDMPNDVIVSIAKLLDGKSIAGFAACCKNVHIALNSSHIPFMHWHQNGMRAPLKIIKEYVTYNEKFLNDCTLATSEKIQNRTLDTYFSSSLIDPNYLYFYTPHRVMFHYNTQASFVNNIINAVKAKPIIRARPTLATICAWAIDSEAVRFLLEHKANPQFYLDDPQVETVSPITCAIIGFTHDPTHKGNLARCIHIIDTLLEYNMSIDQIDTNCAEQWNYLHYVTAIKAYTLLPYLLSKGIDPNVRTSIKGHTPMIMLRTIDTTIDAKEELCNNIKLLLDAKADPHIKNNEGKTILDYIPEAWHHDVQALIDKKM